jgi:hypothetical protein
MMLAVVPRSAGVDAPVDRYRDAGGRRFPAHREVVLRDYPTSSWWCRHGVLPISAPYPQVFWGERRSPTGVDAPWAGQAPRAASTTSLASDCTSARCSGPRKDSA